MVDIVSALNKKKEPSLKKKADDINVPKPQQPNIAEAMGATPKQAQMAASPQAQNATMREARVQAQAPREVPKAGDSIAQAQSLITSLANFNQQNIAGAVNTGTLETEVAGPEVRTVEDLASNEDIANMEPEDRAGTFNEILFGEDGAMAQGTTVTLAELQELDPEIYGEISAYASQAGLGPDATIDDIRTAANQELSQIGDIVDSQRDIMSDPNVPAVERQAAMQTMRDYGASHLIASDKEVKDLEQQLNSADKITVGGREMTYGEMAEDPLIAGTLHNAAELLMADPDASAEDVGLKDSPMLYEFAKKHGVAVLSALDEDADNLEEAKAQVEKNDNVITTIGPDLTEALGLSKFTSKDLNEGLPGLDMLIGNGQELLANTGITQEDLKDSLSFLSKIDPEVAKSWLQSPGNPSDIMEKASEVQAIQKYNFKGTAGVHRSKIRELLEDAKINKEKYSTEDLKALEYYNDPNLQDKLLKDTLQGNPVPQLSGVRTVQERQKKFVEDTVSNIDFTPESPIEVRRTLSDANKALGVLLKVNNPPPFVQEEISRLRKLKKKFTTELTEVVSTREEKDTVEAKPETRGRKLNVAQKVDSLFRDPKKAIDTTIRGGVNTLRNPKSIFGK